MVLNNDFGRELFNSRDLHLKCLPFVNVHDTGIWSTASSRTARGFRAIGMAAPHAARLTSYRGSPVSHGNAVSSLIGPLCDYSRGTTGGRESDVLHAVGMYC